MGGAGNIADGVVVIPLAEIDAGAVLSGARVPLVVPSASEARHEWVSDHYYQRNSYGTAFALDLDALVLSEIFLDPSDPDVARVLDHKIATARLAKGDSVRHASTTPILGATLGFFRDKWAIVVAHVGGEVYWWTLDGMGCDDIEPIAANIPTARAALIRALYRRMA